MIDGLGSLASVRARAMRALRPPPRLTISAWADRYYQLSPESSAVPGQWTTLPYQREPLDAMGDPTVTHCVVMKSARVGYTRMLLASLAYHMHQDPAPCLVIQPTLEDARGFSKDDLQPMVRDCPALASLVLEQDDNGPNNTLLSMRYPGGVVSLIGANSGTGLRRISRKFIAADEVDAYPVLIGEGDVIKLAQKRSEYYHDRKFVAGSTPLIAGHSRIEEMFHEGDMRRYFVPCPQCDHMAPLVFRGDGGHAMTWPDGDPDGAFFTCQANGCVIEHRFKRDMIERGEWRVTNPTAQPGYRSYHMWSALSYSPGAQWSDIAREFVEAKGNVEKLRVFVNTTLGETWKEAGDAPDWELLYARRERYAIGSVPEGVKFITAGVDVQLDRWVYEVVGWGLGKESWSIDAGVIPGNPSLDADWLKLDELLARTYGAPGGVVLPIRMMGVDAGFNTQMVYNWARRHVGSVLATKGVSTARVIIGAPTAVDVTVRGQRIARGAKVWPVGVDIAKSELYGWLRLPNPAAGDPFPSGYCHFPEHDPEWFKQITGEHLVSTKTRQGFQKREWMLQPGRQNHWLDARVYARACAAHLGLDRMPAPQRPVAATPAPAPRPVATPQTPARAPREASWLHGGSDSRFRVGWLEKKR